MGLFDTLKDQAMGKAAEMMGQSNPKLAGALTDLLQNAQGGGLSGLVKQFQDKGLGEIVSSWISTGKNLPITAQQIQNVLGHEKVQQLAAKLGVNPDQVSSLLSQHLPALVDKLTPNGQLPEKV